MKNLAKLVGIIVFVVVIGFSFAACKDDAAKDDLDGTTWRCSITEEGTTMIYVLTFSSPNFTMSQSYGGATMSFTGTYSISGSTVTLTLTMEGETNASTGTLSGNTLTIGDMVFTKQ